MSSSRWRLRLIFSFLSIYELPGTFARLLAYNSADEAKTWAEYLTIVISASLILLEIYESTAKIVLLLLNIAVVAYLVVVVAGESTLNNGAA